MPWRTATIVLSSLVLGPPTKSTRLCRDRTYEVNGARRGLYSVFVDCCGESGDVSVDIAAVSSVVATVPISAVAFWAVENDAFVVSVEDDAFVVSVEDDAFIVSVEDDAFVASAI